MRNKDTILLEEAYKRVLNESEGIENISKENLISSDNPQSFEIGKVYSCVKYRKDKSNYISGHYLCKKIDDIIYKQKKEEGYIIELENSAKVPGFPDILIKADGTTNTGSTEYFILSDKNSDDFRNEVSASHAGRQSYEDDYKARYGRNASAWD
jgi:hypothetical protein